MCNNVISKERPKWWYFTFGCGQKHEGHYVKIRGTYSEARAKMCEKYGIAWAFQYSESEWEETKNDPNRCWKMEEELEVIE